MTIDELLADQAAVIATALIKHDVKIPPGGISSLVICEEADVSVTVHVSRTDEPTPTIPELLEEARLRIFGPLPFNGRRGQRARPRKGPLSIQLLPNRRDLMQLAEPSKG